MTTRFNLFVLSTWLPALQETIQHALENANAIEFDLLAPVRFVWHWFWWLVGKIIKALFLGFTSLVAVIAYAAGPFGWWSIPLGFFVLIFVAPVAFVIWALIWGGVLTCRFASWLLRSITGNPVDRVAQKDLHKEHWAARNLIILGCILLFVFPPFGTFIGVGFIALGLVWGAIQQVLFWFPPKPAPVTFEEA